MSSKTRVCWTLATLVFLFPALVAYSVLSFAGVVGYGFWGCLSLATVAALIGEGWVQMLLYPGVDPDA